MPYYGYYGGYGDFLANNIYCILLIPVLLLSLWAQAQVSGNFKRYSGVANRRRLTGAQAAEAVLRAHGVYDVAIRPCSGNLTDHYDPRDNSISLSENVYNSTSIAAVGVAAHEAGHAVQYAENYGPVRLRTAIIPATQIGSKFSFILLLVGMVLYSQSLFLIGIRAVLPDHPVPAYHPAGGVQRLPPGLADAGKASSFCMTMSCPAHGRC